MRLLPFLAGVLAALVTLPALAQTPPAPAGKPATATAQEAPGNARPDPIIAKVDGHEVRLSDVRDSARNLPETLRGLPPKMLFPLIVDQLIDREAMAIAARKEGIDKDPAIQRQMRLAQLGVLQNALIQREVGPSISEEAVAARYQKQIAGQPGQEQAHARHILVTSEARAKQIIAELEKGADFVALAKKYSTDPGAQSGGDLGWFKKTDMIPEFAEAALALRPGQFTTKPVHTRFGWHVIQLLEVKREPAPTFQEARAQLRQEIVQEAVQKAIDKARAGVKIERFNPDGSPIRASDLAEPPPAPEPPPLPPAGSH
jgi:peptidyl-prolyl cis-trans isomerase C